MADLITRRVPTSAASLSYEESGAGVPILFLHGVGSDKSAWRPQLQALSDSNRCIAIDYPGYGQSAFAAPEMDCSGLARALLEAVRSLTDGAIHVVGLSMGGVVALEMALQSPELVASLTLADSFAYHPDGQAIDNRFQDALRSKPMPEFAASRAPALVGPDCPPALVDEIQAVMSAIPTKAVAWASPIVWRADLRGRLGEIRCPTLVVVGSEDKVTPPDLSFELAQGIPGARLMVVGGAGHLSNLEKPAAFNAALAEFLAGP
jgi:3-oxoadipate enol-lactonase